MKPLGFLLTFAAVVVAMVFFRAKTMAGAMAMLKSMAGFDGISLPAAVLSRLGPVADWLGGLGVTADFSSGATLQSAVVWIAALMWIALRLPNSLEIMNRFEPALGFQLMAKAGRKSAPAAASSTSAQADQTPVRANSDPWWSAHLNLRWAAWFGLLFVFGVMSLNRISEFLYWQF
jgi:alginate O-acetyltransferase complex protein AlgI